MRRGQARTFDEAAIPPTRTGPAVLVLSPELEVRAQTPQTQLLAVEAGVDDHPPSARVHLNGGVWLTLRAGHCGLSLIGRPIGSGVILAA